MRLSLSARWTLKDRPAEYRGLTGEIIAYGANMPLSFAGMAQAVLEDMLEYYMRFTDTSVLNANLDEFRHWLAGLSVVDVESGNGNQA